MQIQQIKRAAEIAKSRTNDKRWINAIDKAVAGVESGWWIVTELFDGIMVTTECGQTYRVNGHCVCRAAELGQPCKHLALRRLLEIAAEIEETAPEAVSAPEHNAGACEDIHCEECIRLIDRQVERDIAAHEAVSPEPVATKAATSRAPRITRSVERDRFGVRYTVTRCDGWMI